MGHRVGTVVSWLAAAVLAEWVAIGLGIEHGQPLLAAVRPGEWVSMKVSTALLFVLAGAALFLVRSRPQLAGKLSLVVALGAVAAQLGWLDALTPETASEAVYAAAPGRISPVASACFVLLAGAVVALVRQHPHVSGALATLSAVLTISSVIGYAYAATGQRVPVLGDWLALVAPMGAATAIAAPTAVLLWIYSLGVVHEALVQLGKRWTARR